MTLSKQPRRGQPQPASRQVRNSGAAIAVAGLLLYAGSTLPASSTDRLSAELVLCGSLLSGVGQHARWYAKKGLKKRPNGPPVS